nr:P2X purinoceptor 7-like [Crassostrea virginica]
MPSDRENVCCGQNPVNCHSRLRDLDNIVLDEGVLEVARRMREDMLVQAHDENYNRASRHTAYRQYVIWIHGHLGAGNRRVVPSCVVLRIRNKYPDPTGNYVGFVPGRLG